MSWIPMAIAAAFLNALWTALSKKQLLVLSSFEFTVLLRGLTGLLFIPFFLADLRWPLSAAFWWSAGGAGLLEVVRIGFLSMGIRRDYYSTYAIYNISPLFTLLLVPYILPEKIPFLLWAGVALLLAGAFIFYGIGKLSLPGLLCALSSSAGAILSKIAIRESSAFFFVFVSFTFGVIILATYGKGAQKRSLNFLWAWPIVKKVIPLALYSGGATILYYKAMETAPVSKVQPMVRANLLFGFLFSYFLLKEKDRWLKKMAAGLAIFIGCVFIALS